MTTENSIAQYRTIHNSTQLPAYPSIHMQTNLCDVYVTIGQAAGLLRVNRATIGRWVRRGKLRGQKMGLVTLIPKEDILKVAKERGTNIIW
jgi:excisionase family DNA binding protein